MHGFDGNTPVEETMRTLDDLVQSGKVRYIAASNFSGWHLMKSQAITEKYGGTVTWRTNCIIHWPTANMNGADATGPGPESGRDCMVAAGGAGGWEGKYRRNSPPPQNGRVAQEGRPVPEAVVKRKSFSTSLMH